MPHADPFPGSAAPADLGALDQTTVRALCDSGYVTNRDYVDLALAQGWAPDPAIRARAAEIVSPVVSDADLYA